MSETCVLVWRGGRYDKVPKVSLDIIRELERTRGEEQGLPALYAIDEDGKVVVWPQPTSRSEVTIVSTDPRMDKDKDQLAMLHSIKGVE